ncbi:MAG: hypothetical protein AUJ85_07310 [Elusimicrobia bacterium CG1_02_37_114]|nr:MAG: hypothetical protein AUJ85_07310 [Elusimicrobia bacterium CG1_02_37_114]
MKFCIALSLITLFIYGCGNNNNKTETTNKPAENPVKEIVKTDSEELKKEKKKTQEIKVTFVELGSVGCIPCKMMQPIMKEIEEEYGDQVKVIFYDVWTEEGKPYAQKYRIRLIPTQVFLDKDGNEYYRHEGYFPKDELVKVLRMKGVE